MLKREQVHILMYSLRVSGGAGLNFCRIANALSESGYQVTAVCGVIDEKSCSMLSSYVNLSELGKNKSWAMLFRLFRVLKRENPDLIFANIGLNGVVCWLSILLSKLSSKFVIREVNSPTLFIQEGRVVFNYFKRHLIRLSYHSSDLVVSLTDEMKEDLIKNWGVSENKIVVIPNGVSLPSDISRPVASDKKIILSVGRLERQKNQALLLDVFSLVLEDFDARLVILGDGSDRDRLLMHAAFLNILPNVEFVGHVNDAAPYYKVADLLVLTSFYEGFPNVLLESLAWGVPVVSVNCSTGPKDIVTNEDYGYLVDSYDPVVLAEYVKRALNKPYNKLTLRSKAGEFSIDKQSSSFVGAIDRVVL